MDERRTGVVIAGAGAAGTLTAIHLARAATARSTALDLTLVDPADRPGRGVAFGTTDQAHLLNVRSGGMSAFPQDPAHFVTWLARQHPLDGPDPSGFARRADYGRYLADCLDEAVAAGAGVVTLRHHRARAVGARVAGTTVRVRTSDGDLLEADAAVVATGIGAPGCSWAPESLASSAFFVADPWAPGALDVVRRDRSGPADVLLVGSGLTMVDLVLSLSGPGARPGRCLHAISRHGELPTTHAEEVQLPVIPDVSTWGDTLEQVRRGVRRHLAEGARVSGGDWRPAFDGLRYRVSELWSRLSESDRRTFLSEDASTWDRHRHRMPTSSAAALAALQEAGRFTLAATEVVGAEPLSQGGLRVAFADGSEREVGWVLNCTGPTTDVRRQGNPILDDLLSERGGASTAVVATEGRGLRTVDGRLIGSRGSARPRVWTLGALRAGELLESVAVPEIRGQAAALASALLDEVAPLPRRLEDGRLVGGSHPVARPRDPMGLPLSTTAEAATAYNAGLERILRLQSGGEDLIRQAAELDPDFAVAHAALAMLAHEAGAAGDVATSLDAAREASSRRGDDRERSFVDLVERRVRDVRGGGASALLAHVARHPRDVLAVSAAVPTIAFSGVTDLQQEAWDLVEGLAPALGDHWWYISLLAFTRQDQSRFDEAGLLAESALACEPSSGHAVHALTHVMYETGRHTEGQVWLDQWVADSGRSATHRAHFSWHAALHELSLGDTEGVRRRYYSQLAPPTVTGVRALIDSAALLWRWRITTSDWDDAVAAGCDGGQPMFHGEAAPPPVEAVIEAADPDLLDRPETSFVATHSAVALAAAGDLRRLAGLRRHCLGASDPTMQSVVSGVCEGLLHAGERRWSEAATALEELMPRLVAVGGSAAQREVVEETLLFALVNAGRAEEALALLDARLDRRTSPLDVRRRRSLTPAGERPGARAR